MALITLACGIGATTAIFSLVNAILLKPLPYPDSDQLVALLNTRQRTHELGIRLALGAESRQVRNMIAWESMRIALIGVVVGMASALGLARILSSFLFGVGVHDSMTFTIVPLTLVFAALGGAWLPACRAARVDPIVALRSE